MEEKCQKFNKLYEKMEDQTREIIDKLDSFESRNNAVNFVMNEVESCKSSLQHRGYRFYEEEHTDELVGGQGIMNKDLGDYQYMKEMAYIKRGINSDWVEMVDDKTRYSEIRDEVEKVMFNYDI